MLRLVLLFVLIFTPSLVTLAVSEQPLTAQVLNISDGDTITVTMNGKTEKVRLIGIDAPEKAQGHWGDLSPLIESSRRVSFRARKERTLWHGNGLPKNRL